MNNRQIYVKDQMAKKLVNEDVTNINDERTEQVLTRIRYDLDTIICNVQYEKAPESGTAKLLQGIQDMLRELTTACNRRGCLLKASGNLGLIAGASVRIALLRLIRMPSVDADAWIEEVRVKRKAAIAKGPIIV